MLFTQLLYSYGGVGEKLLNPTACVFWLHRGCVLASSTNYQNTNTFPTSRIPEFTRAVVTPVANGEYGANVACECVSSCVGVK